MMWREAYARLSKRDTEGLMLASDGLAAAYQALVMQLIYQANLVVARVAEKGRAAMVRQQQRVEAAEAQQATPAAPVGDDAAPPRNGNQEGGQGS
jgi:hypothetical protein